MRALMFRESYREPQTSMMAEMSVTVASGKGDMGKTTVVVSLALSLAIAECVQTAVDRYPVEAIRIEEQERV